MAANEERPLVTFALFAYNQERIVREAVHGALGQTYTPLEIILSDDCSSDRTFEIMQDEAKKYQGSHRIILNRNEENLNLGGHVNKVMSISNGELIVGAAGDDISMPHRVEKTVDYWQKTKADSIYSAVVEIDYDRNILGTKEWPQNIFTLDQILQYDPCSLVLGASHSWHRRIFDVFGPLPIQVKTEDVVLGFRSFLLSKICYVKEPLIYRRIHYANFNNRSNTSSMTTREHIDYYKFLLSYQAANYKSWLKDIKTVMSLKEKMSLTEQKIFFVFSEAIENRLAILNTSRLLLEKQIGIKPALTIGLRNVSSRNISLLLKSITLRYTPYLRDLYRFFSRIITLS